MSVGTAMYREQHEHLLALSGQLGAALDPAALGRDANHARTLLARLHGRLQVHLAMEDRSLYPFLAARPDGPLRETARRFQGELGGLREAFEVFAERWPNAEVIAREPDAFVAGARAILATLTDRIRREEEQLFPLAERSP